MHFTRMALNTFTALALFTGGGLAGVWFTSQYSIVSKKPDTTMAMVQETTLPPPVSELPELNDPPLRSSGGPFLYRFKEGESLRYRLDARVAGTGLELLQASGIVMDFNADMVMSTGHVERDGTANLELKMDRVDVRGNYMNSPFALNHSPTGTSMEMDGQTQSATGSIPIPELDYLKQVISMRVAPNGKVLSLSGAPGMEEMLVPEVLVAPVPFNYDEMNEGNRWESDFTLPVPGLGKPAKAHAVNTLRGYQIVDGRQCAVIDQVLTSEQQGGYAVTAPDAVGGGMSFTMPLFRVRGLNTVYFDVDKGRVHQSDMDVDFDLTLGEEMKPLVAMFDMIGSLLQEVEGTTAPAQEGNLADISVKIKGQMRLAEG